MITHQDYEFRLFSFFSSWNEMKTFFNILIKFSPNIVDSFNNPIRKDPKGCLLKAFPTQISMKRKQKNFLSTKNDKKRKVNLVSRSKRADIFSIFKLNFHVEHSSHLCQLSFFYQFMNAARIFSQQKDGDFMKISISLCFLSIEFFVRLHNFSFSFAKLFGFFVLGVNARRKVFRS